MKPITLPITELDVARMPYLRIYDILFTEDKNAIRHLNNNLNVVSQMLFR